MSRESFFPTQSSSSQHPTNLDPQNLPPIYHTYLQKQQEYAGLQALKEASNEMVQRVEKLAGMSSIMADGGESLGQVLKNWPHVFSVLNLFDKPAETPRSPGGTMIQDEEPEPIPPLVRLEYNTKSTS